MAELAFIQTTTPEGEPRTGLVRMEDGGEIGFIEGAGPNTRGVVIIEESVVPGHDLFLGVASSPEADELLRAEMNERGAREVQEIRPRPELFILSRQDYIEPIMGILSGAITKTFFFCCSLFLP